MVQLARNPIEGGSIVVRVTFKDEAGIFYEPIGKSVFFSLYALHEDNKAWEIVNNRNKSQLPASSIVDIVLQGQDLALLPKCTTKRRLIVDWTYMRNGEVTIGKDMVDFEVVPVPALDPMPSEALPALALPLYVREVFEAAGGEQPKVGIIFNDSVNTATVQDGISSIYVGDSSGDVFYGVAVSWNSDKTIAWCNVDSSQAISGEWFVYISGNIQSVAGAVLGASETLNGSGFAVRSVNFTYEFSIKREYSDGSWDLWDNSIHYYWDAYTQHLWYDGPGDGLIFRKISITANGGAHFQIGGGTGIGVRDLWAWDGGEPGVGVIRHYYTKGQANDVFTVDDEVKTVSE